jgi:peptidoglycan/LPS O-acetylase OafA/YrhL
VPRDIRRFEVLQIVTAILSPVQQLAFRSGPDSNDLIGSALVLVFTLLVSRRRKKWPRWVLLAFYLLGVLLIGYVLLRSELVLSFIANLILVTLCVLQAVALAFAFTRQSSDWLNSRPAHT